MENQRKHQEKENIKLLELVLSFIQELNNFENDFIEKNQKKLANYSYGSTVEIDKACKCGEFIIIENYELGKFYCLNCGVERKE
jgi:hypothetical protein